VFEGDPGHSIVQVKEPAERLNQRSLAWLDALAASGHASTPVFLYLQYMEPHFPYFPPGDALDRILSRRTEAEQERQAYADMLFEHRERWQHPDPVALNLIHDLYDAEVLSLDAQLRDLFAQLDRRKFLRDAIVVITADHGEELMDHGAFGHGATLYNEVTRIPLLLLVPTQTERTDIRGVVSEVDIAPTVLDLAGISAPVSFEGQSLRTTMRRARKSGRLLDFLDGLFHRGNDRPLTAYSELLRLADERNLAPHDTCVPSSSARTS
jgi:arylsulfatase A-like enzyme